MQRSIRLLPLSHRIRSFALWLCAPDLHLIRHDCEHVAKTGLLAPHQQAYWKQSTRSTRSALLRVSRSARRFSTPQRPIVIGTRRAVISSSVFAFALLRNSFHPYRIA